MNAAPDTTQFKAYAALAEKAELIPWEYIPRPLGDHDIELKITHCGVCASDVHHVDNGWGVNIYPMVPGHEIVGTVAHIGKSVTAHKIGDRVGVSTFVWSCQECKYCKRQEEQICKGAIFTYNSKYPDGARTFGGYATGVRVHEHYVFGIPEALSSAGTAPLLCAGITTYTPFMLHNINKDHKVGILGIGGLGHLGVKWAKAFGCETWAISHSAAKEKEAKALGADHFLDTSDAAAVAKMERKLDFLLITANGPNMDYDKLLMMVDAGGVACNVGVPENQIAIKPFSIVLPYRSLSGSIVGGTAHIKEMLAFAAKHKIESDVQVLPLAKVNEALQGVRDGKPRFRYVLEVTDA